MPENPQPGRNSQRRDRVALGFGNLHASPGDHIGHFYQTRQEWKDVIVPFLKAGVEAGEKCVYLIPSGPERQELLEALTATGVNVADALASGRLALDEGHQEPKALQEFLHRVLSEVPGKFPFLRWGGDMTWSMKKLPTSESLMIWETHCNTVENPPAVFLCQYELRAFFGSVVMDALRTHPLCLVSNVVHLNPFYEKPEVFLQEMRQRGTANPPS